MKKMIVTALAVLMTLTLAGCETMKGLGRDISKAGEKIEDAAKK